MTATINKLAESESRPATLNAAIGLSLFSGLAPLPLLPLVNGVDGFIVGITIGFAVLFVAGAWGLWLSLRSVAIGMFVLNFLNGLLSFGSIFTAPEGSPDALDRTLGVVGVLVAVAISAMLLARPTRKALR
ncbi:MAG: hypothetical protein KC482_04220 [Dehalococcoidia bacterium]|nr:hypothetical protein [Dehalococcoidia bacterium]MCA9844410.1 hypothetical protein [Dehalococcoidia bacterium]MCA9852788.1 hypothetical protein [Dehalococcoidia bacterium]